MQISEFKNITETIPVKDIALDAFLSFVKHDAYIKDVEPIRKESDKKTRQELKKVIPYVTISGTFSQRKESGLIKHSGLICLDVDDVPDVETLRTNINKDQYTYASFLSTSGAGLAIIVKIDTGKHLESFYGLEAYYQEKFSVGIDKSCKDVSRARYVTADKDLFVNEKAKIFKKYLQEKKKPGRPAKVKDIICADSDIEKLVNAIVQKGVMLGDDSYQDWLKIGLALSSELKEGGRSLFHSLSGLSGKYDAEDTDKKYNNCLSTHNGNVRIGTLFYLAKQAGINISEIIHPQTNLIIRAATNAKKDGRKNTRVVSAVMPQTGCGTASSTQPAVVGRIRTAPAVVIAAASIAHPVELRAAAADFSASRPPHQCPAENPARTTAMTAVQV